MLSITELRQQHPSFFFEHIDLKHEGTELSITLHYRIEHGPSLQTQLSFPNVTSERFAQLDHQLLQVWAAQLGMVEGLSYWKTCCSPRWVINVPGVNSEQLVFWQNLIHKGLSEFFFIHQINGWESDFVQLILEQKGAKLSALPDTQSHQQTLLIPVGGGKDSVVTTEHLRQSQLPLQTFSINMHPQLEKVLEVFWQGTPTPQQHIEVKRKLDPQLRELNKQGYLNGHTPFSAMVAFTSTLAAYIYDIQFVPLSNEWSANEGNTIFLGQTINHQYSKTVEFERDFREYLQNWLSTTVEYFSFLRPLHEIQIAERFIKFPQYWPVFLSCNRGQRRGIWCGECPKCLFVAIMLSAFLPYSEVQRIIGHDILNNMELLPIFDQLVGFTEVKSLECVGTREETRAAIARATQQQQPLPALVDYAWKKLQAEGESPETLLTRAEQLLHSFAGDHFVPEQLLHYLNLKDQNINPV